LACFLGPSRIHGQTETTQLRLSSAQSASILSITAQINGIEVELGLPDRRNNSALMGDYASALHFLSTANIQIYTSVNQHATRGFKPCTLKSVHRTNIEHQVRHLRSTAESPKTSGRARFLTQSRRLPPQHPSSSARTSSNTLTALEVRYDLGEAPVNLSREDNLL
jgi:hypothetical protein